MVGIGKTFGAMFVLAASVFVVLSGGCGSKSQFNGNDNGQVNVMNPPDDGAAGFMPDYDSGSTSQGPVGGFNNPGGGMNCAPNSPLSCYVNTKCSNGNQTTLTGKVYDPAGKVPIYNVIVFVPLYPGQLPVITPGTNTCNTCDVPVAQYVTVSTTDKTGSFTLTGVPSGANVPLVVQIGKWRRTITIPKIADCETTTLPDTGSGIARLPKNHMEGDMPQMALLTGGEDDLGCFLTRVGIDAAEYSAPQGGGRLDVYQGNGTGLANPFGGGGGGMKGPGLSTGTAGDCTTTSCPLWSSKATFEEYDIVLLACEGDTFDPDETPDGGIRKMKKEELKKKEIKVKRRHKMERKE